MNYQVMAAVAFFATVFGIKLYTNLRERSNVTQIEEVKAEPVVETSDDGKEKKKKRSLAFKKEKSSLDLRDA
jgi:hypothetical protein